MKFINKYWVSITYTLYAALVAIYESSSLISSLVFVPDWIKGVLGILAFAGLVAKNYKTKENAN